MTFCLYECLQAAGLQHHYARFTLVGVCTAAHLLALRIEDYPFLGVSSMKDRTRLFYLIQMLKTLNLKSLINDDVRIYNGNYDQGKEDYNAVDAGLSPDGYRNLDKEVGEHENKPSRVRRRLDFSSHNRNDEPAQGSATPTHLSGSTALYDLHKIKNSKLQSREHHDDKNLQLHLSRGTSLFNSDISLLPIRKTTYKLNSSSATVTSKTFNSKIFKQKVRKRISRRNNDSTYMNKFTPVYEAKRSAGYNYGLPLSSPHNPNSRYVGGQRISVCVRKRPFTRAEFRRGEEDVVTTPGGECVIVHENKEAVDLTAYILQHKYYFDQVFGEGSSNEEVYQKTAYPLVQHMLKGGKATCFAYGQTGAGKTYTMLGSSPGEPGLYALAVRDIFAHLSTTPTYSALLVYVSFFEIYCGQLYDLLDNRKRLFAREDGQKVVHISGLRDVQVESVDSLLKVISLGAAERTQGTSGVNPLSSRSHALLQIQLRGPNQQAAGRMWFVDLAGSERASDAKQPNRQTRMEGAEINQSLLALKECIRSLDKEESHTPFRQSKLTQVLKDSFVGDSMTCMIANISPGRQTTEHTLNTLRYADRVKELKGLGGIRGRRISTMGPSFDHMSNSNNRSTSKDDGTLNNAKLVKQNETFGPTTRLHTRGPFLCSTPKNTRCGDDRQPRRRKEIVLEHVTPIRDFLTKNNRSKKADEGRRMESERRRGCDGHYVREEGTRTELVFRQQSDELQVKERSPEDNLTLTERESGFHRLHIVTRRREEETEQIKTTRQEERCRDRDRQKDVCDRERVKHLRLYHQQLQQFIPPSTTSSVSLHSSTTPSSLPLPLHSSQSLFYTHMDHSLKDLSDTAEAEVDHNRSQIPLLSDETREQSETFMHDCVRREDKMSAGRERRQAWVAETESRVTNAAETNIDARLYHSCDSEDREEISVTGLNALADPDNGVWRSGQEEAAEYYSLESAHSIHDSIPFESQHQRAPAERPLSPSCEHNNLLLTSLNLNESPLESKNAKHDRNIYISPLLSIPETVPSNNHREKKTEFVAVAKKRQFLHVQSCTPATETVSYIPTEHPVYTQSCNHPDFRAKISVPSLSEDYKDTFNIYQLYMDQQGATTSFFRGENRDTSLRQSEIDASKNKQQETDEESPSGVETMQEFVENEWAESLIKLPHGKIFQPLSSAAPDAVTVTEQQKDSKRTVRGRGINMPYIPGVMMSSLQSENNHNNLPTYDNNAAAASSTCASVVTPLTSPAVQCIRSPSEHKQNHCKKSSSSLTEQSENTSCHLNMVHSDNSSTSKIFFKPEPKGQESRSNQQKRSTIHHPQHLKWCLVEAHLEQLKEMEALCHKEGKLLWQQHQMPFGVYVHKLAGILDRKARCVHGMRAQLQLYLTSIQSHHSTRGDDNHGPVI